MRERDFELAVEDFRATMESPLIYKERIRHVAEALLSADDAAAVSECDAEAEALHHHQLRGDGSPYIVHPRRVALLSSAVCVPEATADAMLIALLHDVIEDCGVDFNWVAARYGHRIATAVQVLTAIPGPNESRSERLDRKRAKWERLAHSTDLLVVSVHLMDVLDNCMAWRMIKPDMPAWTKLPRWLWQTIEFQVPIAERNLPFVSVALREEVDYQRERGVELGSWRDA